MNGCATLRWSPLPSLLPSSLPLHMPSPELLSVPRAPETEPDAAGPCKGDFERGVESGVDVDVGDHLDVGSAGAGDSEFDLDRILGDQVYSTCKKRRGSCALGLTHLHRAYVDTVGIRFLRILVCAKKTVARWDYRTLYVSHATVLERDIIDAVIISLRRMLKETRTNASLSERNRVGSLPGGRWL